MAGISVCLSFVGGFMVGVEFVWGHKVMIVDLGIIRLTIEYISQDDIEKDDKYE
jgi:hypothetical protein